MKERYGGNSKLIIAQSNSNVIDYIRDKYPECYKREFKKEIEFGTMIIVPVTPFFKVAVMNISVENDIKIETLCSFLRELQQISDDFPPRNVEFAEDFCWGNQRVKEICKRYIYQKSYEV